MPDTVDSHSERAAIPLFVDMDGTLLRTDVAQELLLRALRSPVAIRAVVSGAVSGGISGIKRALADTVEFRPDLLPFNAQVLEYIKDARRAGRRVILASATDSKVARAVADHTGLFDAVIATEPGCNMKGAVKLAAIRDMAGAGGFEYLGDSNADLPIWQAATWRGFATVPARARAMAGDGTATLTPAHAAPIWTALIRAMRPQLWAKNLLVFLPLLLAQLYTDPVILTRAVLVFVAFSLCASAAYLADAMLDAEADRADAGKSKRPFVAGDLRPVTGVVSAFALMALGLGIGFAWAGCATGLMLTGYVTARLAYSLWLKPFAALGVVMRTLFFALRIVAGAAAIHLLF